LVRGGGRRAAACFVAGANASTGFDTGYGYGAGATGAAG
jgi:hypothetical protein